MDDEIRIALDNWIASVEKSIKELTWITQTLVDRVNGIEKELNKTMTDFLTVPVKSEGGQPDA